MPRSSKNSISTSVARNTFIKGLHFELYRGQIYDRLTILGTTSFQAHHTETLNLSVTCSKPGALIWATEKVLQQMSHLSWYFRTWLHWDKASSPQCLLSFIKMMEELLWNGNRDHNMGTILTLQADATLKQTAKKSQEQQLLWCVLYVNRKEKYGVFCEHDQCLH